MESHLTRVKSQGVYLGDNIETLALNRFPQQSADVVNNLYPWYHQIYM